MVVLRCPLPLQQRAHFVRSINIGLTHDALRGCLLRWGVSLMACSMWCPELLHATGHELPTESLEPVNAVAQTLSALLPGSSAVENVVCRLGGHGTLMSGAHDLMAVLVADIPCRKEGGEARAVLVVYDDVAAVVEGHG